MIATNQPASHKRLFGLDHLRAAAIIFVFIYHYGRLFPHPEWTNSISKFGWTGVDLFFVLSGYLISAQLFKTIARSEKISFKIFFTKRFFRIIPAYLLVVVLYFIFPSFREREALAPLWKYLTFTQNIGLDLKHQGTFSHAWSLCIEEQFYFLLPLILIALVRFKLIQKGYRLLLLLFLLGFAARLYCWHTFVMPMADSDDLFVTWYQWIYYPTWGRLDGLLVGVFIAAFCQFKPLLAQRLQQYGHLFLLASLVILTSAYFICAEQESFASSIVSFPLVAIGYGAMVFGAISARSFLYKKSSIITSSIATLSYVLYLTHKIIIHLTQQQFGQWHIEKDSNSMFIICIITSFSGALLIYKIIEKPFFKLRDKLLKVKTPGPILPTV